MDPEPTTGDAAKTERDNSPLSPAEELEILNSLGLGPADRPESMADVLSQADDGQWEPYNPADPLPNDRHEVMARLIGTRGLTKKAAYKAAYRRVSTASPYAITKRPEVKARIEWLSQQCDNAIMSVAVLSKARLARAYSKGIRRAVKVGLPKGGGIDISAVKLLPALGVPLAKLMGYDTADDNANNAVDALSSAIRDGCALMAKDDATINATATSATEPADEQAVQP